MYNVEEVKKKVKELVNEERYEHSLLTGEAARLLAKRYNYDEEIAYAVGISHDIAKDFSDDENKYWIHKYNLDERLLDNDYKKMIHADIGALVCKEWFNFNDEMCNAIKYHTVANEEMSLLDKIIFIADKIGRNDIPEDLKDLKDIALNNIDEAIVVFLENERIMLNKKGYDLLPGAMVLLNNLKKEKTWKE